MKRKQLIAGLLAATAVLSLAGCGSNTPAASDNGSASDSDGVRTVRVGTRGTLYPYTYLDEKNNLTGYDIEVLKLVDEKLPDVTFDFQTMDLSACFVALDGGQLDMIANQLVHNDERDQKYDFSTVPYCYAYHRLVVRGDDDSIQSLDDLKGKTLAVVPTSEANTTVQEFNKTADPKINVTYFDSGSAEILQQVATGQADAGAAYKPTVDNAVKEQGYNLKVVGEPLNGTPTYFIFSKSEENQKLIAEIDQAVQELKDNGTLTKLSEQFLGEDDAEPLEDNAQ